MLNIFIARMKRLGIDIELMGNYPWIYIYTINGKRVTEQFLANHGFTIAFQPAHFGPRQFIHRWNGAQAPGLSDWASAA